MKMILSCWNNIHRFSPYCYGHTMPHYLLYVTQTSFLVQVFANTPSEGELQRGDVIVAINGRDTGSLSHKQAQDAISGGGGQIELLVQRCVKYIALRRSDGKKTRIIVVALYTMYRTTCSKRHVHK